MTQKVQHPPGGRRKVTFSLSTESATTVLLGGDFNQWIPERHPMKADGDGTWHKSLFLGPGTYEYKFLVDGVWQVDPQNPVCCVNCFGTRNSVLIVGDS